MTTDQSLATWRQHAAAASGCISSEPIYQAVEMLLQRHQLQGDVLDFGAGYGVFTRRLHALDRFRSITAADIMSRPADLSDAIRWQAADLNEPLAQIADRSFDLVVAVEVIEHLENPRALAREWFRLLRPGGTLIMSTPNNETLRAMSSLAYKGHFALFNDESYPAHLTALLRKDIERVLSEAGFQFGGFVFTDSGTIPGFRKLTWQALSGGLLAGLRYSDNLVAIANRP